MNVLYILGNGFDMAQGMKTSYPHFYKYLMETKCSPLLEQMKKEITADKKLWSDMEEAFGLYTANVNSVSDLENLYFELSDQLQNYLKTENAKFNPSEKQKNKFVLDFISPQSHLGETDKVRYSDLVNRFGSTYDISVMTLNYTDTLEKLLTLGPNMDKRINPNVYIRQVVHVHGRLGDSIIIGVDNEGQIANEKFRNNEDAKDFLVKNQSNYTMKFTRHTTCKNLISNAHLIIMYGVSIGETDARWWKMIGEQFKNRNTLTIIQYLYAPNEITPTRKQLMGRVERGHRNTIMKKMGFKDNEWPEDTNDRLFFIINSNAFKL